MRHDAQSLIALRRRAIQYSGKREQSRKAAACWIPPAKPGIGPPNGQAPGGESMTVITSERRIAAVDHEAIGGVIGRRRGFIR